MQVVAYCTHPVLSGGAVERIADSALDELVVTDTIPLREEARACNEDPRAVGRGPARRNDPADQTRDSVSLAVHRVDATRVSRFAVTSREAAWSRSRVVTSTDRRGQMKIKINALKREAQGTGASRRLRRAGKSGYRLRRRQEAGARSSSITTRSFHALRKEAFHSSILDMELGGGRNRCCCATCSASRSSRRCCTWTSSGSPPNKKIHIKVPLHFMNAENRPA